MTNGAEEVSMPRALKSDEVLGLLAENRYAARAARRADFGEGLHSTDNHLLDQFAAR